MTRILMVIVLFVPAITWATHPLITDDSGTQGKGNSQLEVNGQYDSDKETVAGVSKKSTGGRVGATLSFGIIEKMDLVLGVPYIWGKVEKNEGTVYDEKGISDTTFEVKWRFFEKDGWSLALKPGLRFPTGEENKGLGTGKIGYRVFLIASKEVGAWAFHANLGYIGNENKVDEEKNIWHASFATIYEVVKHLKIVGNIGIERSLDQMAHNDPAFLIGGVIYSVSNNFDLDLGVKYGLTWSETDLAVLAGITLRF
jgi:hypothetical protein